MHLRSFCGASSVPEKDARRVSFAVFERKFLLLFVALVGSLDPVAHTHAQARIL